MKLNFLELFILSTCLTAACFEGCSRDETKACSYEDERAVVSRAGASGRHVSTSWDAKSAAAYLDQRETWWMKWPGAKRDHGTFCVSCHTVVPYVIARPALRKALAEEGSTAEERLLLANVTKRVHLWKEVMPFYNDQEDGPHKTAESRSTEAVLNAFILANSDEQTGKLSQDSRAAFDNMWRLQQGEGEARGSWLWEVFNLKPWESRGSDYFGAALAAIAVGTAPENYRDTPEIQNNLTMLGEYLRRNSAAQSPMNRGALSCGFYKIARTSHSSAEAIN